MRPPFPLALDSLGALLVALTTLAACDAEPERVRQHTSSAYPTASASPIGGLDALDASDSLADTASGDTTTTHDTLSPDLPDPGPDVTDTTPPGDTQLADTDPGPDTVPPSDTTPTPDTEPPLDTAPDPTPPTTPAITAAAKTTLSTAVDNARNVGALAGHTFGGAIIDLETGELVYGSRQTSPMIPASNTKVFTTAAAIALLGEDYRLLTRVFAPANPDASGRVTSLAIHSGHDFSWSRWFYANPREPLDVLADRLYRRGLRRVEGPLDVWGAYCYEGQSLGTYDPATHRTTAAARFRDALTARGITVTGQTNLNASMNVPSGVELARFESLPLHTLLWPINRVSHNEMADILLRHLGYAKGTESSYTAGAKVVKDWLAASGFDTAGFVMNDGSGLATTNRFTALQLANLYRLMSSLPVGPAWRTSLSIGGGEGPGSANDAGTIVVTTNTAPYMGTLAYRMTGADIAGRVFGKSGTNAGITTTGVLVHRFDQREYAFAFLMNGISSNAYASARSAQDAMVTALGKRLRGNVDPPDAPTLLSAELSGSYRVRLTWTSVAGVSATPGLGGYFVHLSSDGRTFPSARRRHTTATSLELPPLAVGERLYAAVSAVSPGGESARSSVLAAARGPDGANHVLLVDGNDRWQRQPTNENPMGAPHAFIAREAEALDGIHLDSAANEAVTAASLDRYDVVVMSLGEESATHETFSPTEQFVYQSYLQSGGALLVSGAETAWDLDPRGNTTATASDRAFLEGWLKSGYGSDDANTFVAALDPAGVIYTAGLDLERIDFYTPGQMFVAFPDVLTPLDGASVILRYPGSNAVAATAWSGPFKVANLGFPLASVAHTPTRARLAHQLLEWLAP